MAKPAPSVALYKQISDLEGDGQGQVLFLGRLMQRSWVVPIVLSFEKYELFPMYGGQGCHAPEWPRYNLKVDPNNSNNWLLVEGKWSTVA